jgi:hypothetical protein
VLRLQKRPAVALRQPEAGEPLNPSTRDAEMLRLHWGGRFTMRQIAEQHGGHVSTASRAVAKTERPGRQPFGWISLWSFLMIGIE